MCNAGSATRPISLELPTTELVGFSVKSRSGHEQWQESSLCSRSPSCCSCARYGCASIAPSLVVTGIPQADVVDSMGLVSIKL